MKKRWMKWTVLICFFEQIKAYNVREEADGIIGPGLGTNGFFGYSVAANEKNIIIGAPFQNESGRAYICSDTGSCEIDSPDTSGGAIAGSMYGAVSQWIDDEKYITCQPRFHVVHWCDEKTGTCVESDRSGGDWEKQMFLTGRCYIKNVQTSSTKILQKCDYDPLTRYAPRCTDKGLGFAVALLDRGRVVVSNPLHNFQQGTIGMMSENGRLENWSSLSSTSATVDKFFADRPDELQSLPDDLFQKCHDKDPKCKAELVANFDHTHLGLSMAPFGNMGVLVGAPHRYRSRLAGGVSFYPIRGRTIDQFESWVLDSSNFTDGSQMGELFGWSIAVGDFNNDGHYDVAIGAPTWSSGSLINAGRVYIFIGPNENNIFKQYLVIDGAFASKQFGTSLLVKDVDSDGYDDLLVGAPFPSDSSQSGEVRIYNGHYHGLRADSSQVIKSDSDLQNWFGFSLTSQHESIIIGSPKGEKVTIFKFKPAVKLIMTTENIPVHSIKYDEQIRRYDVCVTYDDTQAPTELDFYISIFHDEKYGRTTKPTYSFIQLAKINQKICQEITFRLIDNPTYDKHHDLNISISATIVTPNIALDPFSKHSLTELITFDKNCGDDNICQSDLSLSAHGNTPEVVYGEETNTELTAILNVDGENSYGTVLYIESTSRFQSGIRLIGRKHQSAIDCASLADDIIQCHIGNPAEPGPIRMKFRYFLRPSWDEKATMFFLSANNTNTQKSQTERVSVTIPHKISAKVNAAVEVTPKIVTYLPELDPIVWKYTIFNNGPSVIDGSVTVNFPKFALSGYGVMADLGAKIALYDRDDLLAEEACYVPNDRYLKAVVGSTEEQYQDMTINDFRSYDCTSANSSALCVGIKCHLSDWLFEKAQRMEVTVTSRLSDGRFQHFKNYQHSKFTPEFIYEVDKVPYKQMHYYEIITSKTTFTVLIPAPILDQIPLLWIILAVLGGLLLLSIIAVIMYRTGCFTRKPQSDYNVHMRYETAIVYKPDQRPDHAITLNPDYGNNPQNRVY